MMRNIGFLFGLVASLTLPCVAGAQNPQPAQPHEPHPSLAPPNATQPPPEQIVPRNGVPGAGGSGPAGRSNFSDRLSQQQGTLQPPTVDPGIHAPLPSNGRGAMPVIPPPGTPGGDRNVVPK
jgi:hypothetical protein